jgi:hypothetical protein
MFMLIWLDLEIGCVYAHFAGSGDWLCSCSFCWIWRLVVFMLILLDLKTGCFHVHFSGPEDWLFSCSFCWIWRLVVFMIMGLHLSTGCGHGHFAVPKDVRYSCKGSMHIFSNLQLSLVSEHALWFFEKHLFLEFLVLI